MTNPAELDAQGLNVRDLITLPSDPETSSEIQKQQSSMATVDGPSAGYPDVSSRTPPPSPKGRIVNANRHRSPARRDESEDASSLSSTGTSKPKTEQRLAQNAKANERDEQQQQQQQQEQQQEQQRQQQQETTGNAPSRSSSVKSTSSRSSRGTIHSKSTENTVSTPDFDQHYDWTSSLQESSAKPKRHSMLSFGCKQNEKRTHSRRASADNKTSSLIKQRQTRSSSQTSDRISIEDDGAATQLAMQSNDARTPQREDSRSSKLSVGSKLGRRGKRRSNVNALSIVIVEGVPIIKGYPLASPKSNDEFHALFDKVPRHEHLINDYGCALQREILAHGRMHISVHHLCFYANILGWTTNLVINFADIVSIEKEKTAFVIPNAILITTGDQQKYFFASFLSRDKTYDLLRKLWNYARPSLSAASMFVVESDYQSDGVVSLSANDPSGTEDESKAGEGLRRKGFLSKIPTSRRRDRSADKPAASSSASPSQSPPPSPPSPSSSPSPRASSDRPAQPENLVTPAGVLPPTPRSHVPARTGMSRRSTQCACSQTGEHYKHTSLDAVFSGSVEKVFNLIFTSNFVASFLDTEEKCTEINIGEWIEGEDNILRRSVSYVKPLGVVVGPKSTKCYLEDECIHRDFDDYVTAVTTTSTPEVKSGNAFLVKTRMCITWAGHNKTRVLVTADVAWSKSSIFKVIIEKRSLEGMDEFYQHLDRHIRQYIASHPGEFQDEIGSPIPEATINLEDAHGSLSKKLVQTSARKSTDDTIEQKPTTRQSADSLPSPSDTAKLLVDVMQTLVSTISTMNLPSRNMLVAIAFAVLAVANVVMLVSLDDLARRVEAHVGQSYDASNAFPPSFRHVLSRWQRDLAYHEDIRHQRVFAMLDLEFENDREMLREWWSGRLREVGEQPEHMR